MQFCLYPFKNNKQQMAAEATKTFIQPQPSNSTTRTKTMLQNVLLRNLKTTATRKAN